MRFLQFSTQYGPHAAENYAVIHGAFLSSTTPLANLADLRTASKILDKLEAISTMEKEGRVLLAGKLLEVELEDAEYELLLKTLRNAQWRTQFAREALRALTFLENAPEKNPVGPTPKSE